MPRIALRLFGSATCFIANRPIRGLGDAFGAIVASLLAARPNGMSRNLLAEQVWPDKESHHARRCLATTLWRIRARDEFATLISAENNRLRLAAEPHYWIDTVAFERRVTAALADVSSLADVDRRHRLRRGLELYRGDLLPDFECDAIAIERERLRALYLDGLFELATADARAHDWPRARLGAETLCRVEPLREDAHRLLMHALAASGSRALALQHFRHLSGLLRSELGVTPMPETADLARELSSDGASVEPPGSKEPDARRVALRQARDNLTSALALLDLALAD